MKKLTLLLLVLAFSSFVQADDADIEDVKTCLRNFGKHPFNAEKPSFDVLATRVKVFGIGGNTTDTNVTKEPNLVLIKPNVTVLSKTELHLLNPNGWYCLKGQVAVLGKSKINLHCKAKITSSSDGMTVLGKDDGNKGVTVLGSTNINLVGCEKSAAN